MEFECMWRVPVVSILHTEVSSSCLRRTWEHQEGAGEGLAGLHNGRYRSQAWAPHRPPSKP